MLAPSRILATRVWAVCLLLYAVASVASPPAAATPGRWQRPVPGALARAFDYTGDPFAAGRHRGADFAARPGQPVRSACAGRVMFAGTAGSNGPTVSVRCGEWRVAYLPLRTLAVRRGARVARGSLLGSAAGSGRHAGLHVGVRREGSRWGYVDPVPFFGAAGQLPLAPPTRSLRPPPSSPPFPATPRPTPLRRPVEAPARDPARPTPLRRPAEVPARDPARPTPLRRPVKAPASGPQSRVEVPARGPQWQVKEAPWPAWAGLTLILAAACGAGLTHRRRAPRPRPRATVPRVARE